jgi:uncharacterized phage-associated protein
MSAISAHDVAAELRRRVPNIGAKKLHKLLYYCQGHHLATFDEPLFSETISAWDMGPVVGQLWKLDGRPDAPAPHEIADEAQLNTIGYVLSRYGALNGNELERLTHTESPWLDANEHRAPRQAVKITVDAIKDFFRASQDDDSDQSMLPDSDEVSKWLGSLSAQAPEQSEPNSLDQLRRLLCGVQ